jgi:hypothetical protein
MPKNKTNKTQEINMSNRPIAMRAIENARLNVGVKEEGNNAGAAVESYLASCNPSLPPGNPWCVAVVRFRLKQAATQLGLTYDVSMPRTAYTPDYVRWAQRTGNWVSLTEAKNMPFKIRQGDLVCFWFSALNRHAHMGVVDRVREDGTGVLTIEGNTCPENFYGDERDGDGYYPKVRDWSELGVRGGFIKLDF